jgi:ribosomal protein L22
MADDPDKKTDEPAPAGESAAPAAADNPHGAPSGGASPSAEEQSATPPHGDELADAIAEGDEERVGEAPDVAAPADAEQPAGEAPNVAAPADAEQPAGEASSATAKPPRADRVASTPRRRRERATRQPGEPAPVVRAQAKYVRSSARKARLVCDHIRGKSVVEARAILAVTPRAIARDWSKLLESAVANAEHNHELVGEDLVVKAVHADEGPTIKRFRPRAMGRATRIRKRTSHLTILLTPKD